MAKNATIVTLGLLLAGCTTAVDGPAFGSGDATAGESGSSAEGESGGQDEGGSDPDGGSNAEESSGADEGTEGGSTEDGGESADDTGGSTGGVDEGSTGPGDSTGAEETGQQGETGGMLEGVGFMHNCAYAYNEHEEPNWNEPELHVIGLYEGSSDHDIIAPVSLHVDRDADVVLVLSSYERVEWTVTAEAGTTIQTVLLNGYKKQSANVPQGTQVLDYSGIGQYIVGSAYDWNDPDTAQLVSQAEIITNTDLATFHGCYRATDMILGKE